MIPLLKLFTEMQPRVDETRKASINSPPAVRAKRVNSRRHALLGVFLVASQEKDTSYNQQKTTKSTNRKCK
jgi:hypothetical protein